MSNNLMILGAGIFQLPLILRAKEMGYNTIVVSPSGDYPGIEVADVFFESDIRETDRIISWAKRQNIVGIVTTGSDAAMQTLGAVVDHFGLIGPTRAMAETVIFKTGFRQFQKDKGLPHPEFKGCRTADEALHYYHKLSGKVVVKPDDSSGSRGVTVLETGLSGNLVRKAFCKALDYSNNKVVCIEEFIEGIEVGGDGFVIDGEFVLFFPTLKHMNGPIVHGHTYPCGLLQVEHERVKHELASAVRALKYKNGPVNFDVMISKDSVTIIEMTLRNGGNGITEIIQNTAGVDMLQLLLQYATGLCPELPEIGEGQPASSYIFGAKYGGVLKRMPSLDSIKVDVPEVFQLSYAKTPGSKIDKFSHNAHLAGYLLFEGGGIVYNNVIERIERVLEEEMEVALI